MNSSILCPTTSQLPRFHAIDYIEQVTEKNPLVNRRAISSDDGGSKI